ATFGGAYVMRLRAHRALQRPEAEATSGAPVTTSLQTAGAGTPRGDVTIDARRQQLLGVRTVHVARLAMAPSIRAVGTVRYDETRLTDVNLKLEGWIRDLFVDYTGQFVRKG